MKVKDLLSRLGNNIRYVFDITWQSGKNEPDDEKNVKSEDIGAVKELFGEWNIAEEESIHITPKEDTVIISLYLLKNNLFSTAESFEEEIICPQCGAEHDIEDDEEPGRKHQCFYCGFEWFEDDTKKE